MTYKEIKDRLSKCELTLEKIKDGSSNTSNNLDISKTTKKLEILRESLQKQLSEADKGVVVTDDETTAADLAKKGVNVKLTSEMKPGDEESQQHERMKRLSPQDQETIAKIHALMNSANDIEETEETDSQDTHTMPDGTVMPGADHIEPEEEGDLDVGHQDDEPSMLGSTALETAEYAAKLYKKLQRYDNMDGEVDFPHWWQSKLVLAREYMSAAYHYLDSEEKQPALDQLALEENVDKVAGGIPYRRHGNKVIISEPLDDATKERLMAKAKDRGYFAQPNQSGGITITLKKGMYELSSDAREGLTELQGILDRASELGEEARDIVRTFFPDELNTAEAYDVFNFGSSSNSYDNTLESLIRDIEEQDGEDEGDDLDEAAYDSATNNELAQYIINLSNQLKSAKANNDKKEIEHLQKDVDEVKAALARRKKVTEAGPGFAHDCAAKVVHEKYGKGTCIPEKHTLVKEGKKYVVTHYDVLFENNKTVVDIPVNELDIKTTNEHWHKGYKKKKK